jgi:hypothetical protein
MDDSFVPPGLVRGVNFTPGLRQGLYSFAAARREEKVNG